MENNIYPNNQGINETAHINIMMVAFFLFYKIIDTADWLQNIKNR